MCVKPVLSSSKPSLQSRVFSLLRARFKRRHVQSHALLLPARCRMPYVMHSNGQYRVTLLHPSEGSKRIGVRVLLL